jgi:hypothetical protein
MVILSKYKQQSAGYYVEAKGKGSALGIRLMEDVKRKKRVKISFPLPPSLSATALLLLLLLDTALYEDEGKDQLVFIYIYLLSLLFCLVTFIKTKSRKR